jgi:homoserine O-acetyltransferase
MWLCQDGKATDHLSTCFFFAYAPMAFLFLQELKAKMTRNDYPATGAWQVGQPSGRRVFANFPANRPFALDGGTSLRDVTIAYETWGTLNDQRNNAVLLCHAWTGDSHAAGPAQDGHPAPGWWENAIGPGRVIDTDRWFVVCSNVIGGCQGSTGPASAHPDDANPYASRFPVITVRDMVRAQVRLTDMLKIPAWHSIIGGSMGGMQVLEWAITFPDRVRTIVPIATCAQATAQQIAWGAIGRRAIALDPKWRGGEYYDAAIGDGPWEGLSIARMISQVTFRSDNVFTDRFGRELADSDALHNGLGLWDRFEVEGYLDHHGDRLNRRFDANSYLLIGKAMDLHDVARGRGGLERAMSRIRANALVMGISSDMLYPTYQQKQLHSLISGNGVPSTYVEVDSPHGHDAFLINLDQVGPPIGRFLATNFAG